MKTPAAALALMLVCGCGALKPTVSPAPNLYSLGDAGGAAAAVPGSRAAAALTLTVSPPHAAAGFDSPRMMYQRQAEKLEYFAHNEWVDTPARMLAPLIVAAIEGTGAFRAVVQMPSTAAGDLRLDIEILNLQQEFLAVPSRVRLTLRAYIVESATRRVIATRDIETVAPAASEDPQGGVKAANRAVQTALERLAGFCADTASNWRPAVPAAASAPKGGAGS